MRLVKLISAALSASVLSACVMVPQPYSRGPVGYGGAPGGQPQGYGAPGGYDVDIALANVPPPAPYVEVIPVLPFFGALWIAGYWGWSGGRHHWVGGHYERPRAGYGWAPHRWVPQSNGWALRGGGWTRH